MNEAYLQYLENVLGLKQLVWPEAIASADVEETSASVESLSILFLADKAWSAPAQQLFEKMRDAMKVSETETRVLFADEAHLPEIQVWSLAAKTVVCFSEKLYQQIQSSVSSVNSLNSMTPAVSQEAGSQSVFLTYGPDQLLKQPQLKKEAWSVLQLVMKTLGL